MVTELYLNENDTIHPLSRVANSKIESVLDQLPTLDDVLHRQSQPPVCLYNYYIVLRDRLELEILLDFWLDVAQADILYKRYMKYANKRASTKFSSPKLPKPSISSSILDYHHRQSNNSNSNDILTHMLLLHPRASLATTMYSTTTNGSQPKRPPPTQTEMMEAIERIYLRYIVPSAEKEIVQLPVSIKESIGHHFYDSEKKDPSLYTGHPENPIIYAQAKEYVHQLLESTFPLFLRYKVFMNLTLPQQIGRLACGLVLLLVGFSLEFSLIFLNIHPWQKRLWGILPIILGVFCVITSITGIDPVWVLGFNLSETVPFQFNHIVHCRVRAILRRRSIVVSAIILFTTLVFMIFFCAVAGKRL
ncbi:RGS domain-containing protein [Mucor ambiguus]|uniref:RGS domain-containing protein n=1 Tax=Mucor ambiguus TaxID=91626 RepID=A0A0C9LWW6_9FUNG|nr:RGS domain-containing protein [Mucor ambiguus]